MRGGSLKPLEARELAELAAMGYAGQDDPDSSDGDEERLSLDGYFLIVWDFLKYAKAHKIPVGPGRGRGAGSLVAWCLRITDLDPMADIADGHGSEKRSSRAQLDAHGSIDTCGDATGHSTLTEARCRSDRC